MRKALVPFLVLGLLLLGVSPVMAAGEQVKAQLGGIADTAFEGVVLPAGNELDEGSLEVITGDGVVLPIIAALLILAVSLRSCSVEVDLNSDGNPEFKGKAKYGEPRIPVPVPGRKR